jgi:hypothetical protein
MVILGPAVSEEPGSGEVASWLKTFIIQFPVKFLSSNEPFWRPAQIPSASGYGHERIENMAEGSWAGPSRRHRKVPDQ